MERYILANLERVFGEKKSLQDLKRKVIESLNKIENDENRFI